MKPLTFWLMKKVMHALFLFLNYTVQNCRTWKIKVLWKLTFWRQAVLTVSRMNFWWFYCIRHMHELCSVHACSVVSNSLRPHGLQPSRLLCPWDSPGKNTGEGWYFFLQGIFPTQGSSPGLWCLLHCSRILHRWAIWEAPRINNHHPETSAISCRPAHCS